MFVETDFCFSDSCADGRVYLLSHASCLSAVLSQMLVPSHLLGELLTSAPCPDNCVNKGLFKPPKLTWFWSRTIKKCWLTVGSRVAMITWYLLCFCPPVFGGYMKDGDWIVVWYHVTDWPCSRVNSLQIVINQLHRFLSFGVQRKPRSTFGLKMWGGNGSVCFLLPLKFPKVYLVSIS